MNRKHKRWVTHLHEGFEDTLMLESGRILESALILTFASLLGTARVDITLGPFTRNDLDALERSENLFGLFAGERPIVSTRLGALVDSCNRMSSEGWRRLDRLLAFSLRMGPMFERRRELLDCVDARGADVGRRRVGLPSRSRYLGMCRDSISSLFMLRSESGGARRMGESSSAS